MLTQSNLVLRRCREAHCKPLCAFKTQYAVKTATKGSSRKLPRQPPAISDSPSISAQQYLITAGLSAAAGVALTVAPQTVWQLLGSHDIVNVTLSSSQVGAAAHVHCTPWHAAAGCANAVLASNQVL